MIKPLASNMGADALRAATGRDHDGWREVLRAAGALDWDHARIARHLVDAHGVDGWWAQSITVDFEQACQGRLPGQRADGTFAVSKTMTIPGERLIALDAVVQLVVGRHGEPHGQNLAASQPVMRWRLPDGTRLQAAAQQPNKSGTPIGLTWERLADPEALARAQAELVEMLEAARSAQ